MIGLNDFAVWKERCKSLVMTSPKKQAIAKNKKSLSERHRDFLSRRPHRSFRFTRKRDHKRSLKLPGYWSFTNEVRAMLWQHKELFAKLLGVYAISSMVLVGMISQETYTTFSENLSIINSEVFSGGIGPVAQAAALFGATATGSLNQTPSESQQIYGGLLFLLGWLITVWLLRQLLAGHKVKLRDAIYSSGAPIVSTFIILLVILVQLLPLALALIGYGAAQQTGLLEEGFASMLFWVIASLLALMSLYWITSSFIALIIVTLPGMYPFIALKNAGDLVVGRRLKITLRLLWLVFVALLVWAVVLIPIILLAESINVTWLPLVPIATVLLSSFTLIWSSSYVYLLYRKIIDDKAPPA